MSQKNKALLFPNFTFLLLSFFLFFVFFLGGNNTIKLIGYHRYNIERKTDERLLSFTI